jgi:malonyl-CoA O-methyltransferase
LDQLKRQAVRASFDRIAACYDDHAALGQEIASRLLERVDFLRQAPRKIVDLGCGTGDACAQLKNRFRKADVTGLDWSVSMLQQLQGRSGFMRPLKAVCADFGALPFADRSADLLYSNLALHWMRDLTALLAEIRRVLRPNGSLLFTCFGPESLRQLRSVWPMGGESTGPQDFADMHEWGDALMAAGFREPVMDAEIMTLTYPGTDLLMRELELTGISGLVPGWERTEEGKRRLAEACEPFLVDGLYPLTFEILYGAAHGPEEGQPRKTPTGDVVTFSVDSLRSSGKIRSRQQE